MIMIVKTTDIELLKAHHPNKAILFRMVQCSQFLSLEFSSQVLLKSCFNMERADFACLMQWS